MSGPLNPSAGPAADPASTDASSELQSTPDGHIRESQQRPTDISSTSSGENATAERAEKDEGSKRDKSHSQGASETAGLGRARIAVIMLSLCIALFLAALDMTIVTTALPEIASQFEASTSEYTWVGSAYLLASAASVPLWGKLGDIWGRKPVILLANVIFLVGSLLCGLATGINMLIGGRVIQGVGGGGLIILVNIVISDLFSMRDRAKYFGIIGMVWAIASALGPILGGVFTQEVTWRWCFYINLPLDGCAFVMLSVFLKLHTPRTPFLDGIKAIDWVGVVAIVGGVVMFLLGLESGGVSHPWDSAFTLCLIIFGVATLALFFVNEWKFAKYPIMPLRLFNNRGACAAFTLCFLHGFVFIAGTYFLPLYFQAVLVATPLMSGVYLLPFVLVLSIFSGLVGVFIKKTGRYREPIWFGFVLMTLGVGLFIDLPPTRGWAKMVLYQVIAGVGIGPNFQSPLIALQSTVHPRDIATATGTFGFVRQLSTSLSVVLGGVIFTNVFSEQLQSQRQSSASSLPDSLLDKLTASTASMDTAFLRSLAPAQKVVIDSLYTSSLARMWVFYTAVSALGILVSLLVGKRVLSREHQQTRTGLAEMERGRQERQAAKSLGAAKQSLGAMKAERDAV